MSRRFVFGGSWLVAAPPGRVHAVLVDLEHYPDWWPQVRAVAKIDDDHARVLCRASLPYTLDLVLTAVERGPHLLETRLDGDLEGFVRWRIGPDAAGTRLVLEQEVVVTGRLMALAAYVTGRPLRWNHEQMMAGGLAGLRSRLAQASSSGE
ncbi:SRPBCC family protein [Nocardioides coralli]|uniref:SRPBCC family protein n=1 Tax=Nocardioides coralli TaxID=2872154 RepID=UPI001CA3E006|nr:SRPBCC family protein [Nocardioides coralli]QZY29940.1 SRPBCC family protein [Nocardioides coralli]